MVEGKKLADWTRQETLEPQGKAQRADEKDPPGVDQYIAEGQADRCATG